jgi:hypothetical protein
VVEPLLGGASKQDKQMSKHATNANPAVLVQGSVAAITHINSAPRSSFCGNITNHIHVPQCCYPLLATRSPGGDFSKLLMQQHQPSRGSCELPHIIQPLNATSSST